MPTYAFRNGRHVVTRMFRIADRPDHIVVRGKVFKRSLADERPGVPSSAGWPIECVASGVCPDQAGELREFYRKHGVPTEVSADGNPIYRNAAHRRKALKVRGLHDNSSYL